MAKAFIISSNKETRFIYEKAIAFQKFIVLGFESIKKAMTHVTEEWPDLIVIDFDDTIAEEIEELKKLIPPKKHLPMIIVSDLDDAKEKKQACVTGVCKYLSKSKSTLGDLIKAARKVIK